MMSHASSRGYASYVQDDGDDNLRSKRSSITIECSDGSKVVFVRPRRPRLGSSSVSQSPPPSSPTPHPPAPKAPASYPGDRQRRGRRRSRPSSMPTQPNVYNDIQANQSNHVSLPNLSPGRRTASPLHPNVHAYPATCAPRGQSQCPVPESHNTGALSPTHPVADAYNINTKTQRTRPSRNSHNREGTPKPPLRDPTPPTGSDILRPSSSVHGETGRVTPLSDHREHEGSFLSPSMYSLPPQLGGHRGGGITPPDKSPTGNARQRSNSRTLPMHFPGVRNEYLVDPGAASGTRTRYMSGALARNTSPLGGRSGHREGRTQARNDEPRQSRGYHDQDDLRFYRGDNIGAHSDRQDRRSLEAERRCPGSDRRDTYESTRRGEVSRRQHDSEDDSEEVKGCFPFCCWPIGNSQSRHRHREKSRPRGNNRLRRRR
ncbi:hypothetical protein GGS21DRAFT_133527 [Xylaria nigripes]|nr:hypothetical protein GGS21DRAFT_133527 [Xylaria nigripes]